ncbi:MAG TPA: hypothetical protein PKW44_01855 [Methylophilaceae bacterium]|nr:hypothetical protein [Methylophilaceae bacterium]HQR60039.1 hypothetical protein [Methylophilaceae bacterium]
MCEALKSGYSNLITSCGHLVLILVALRINQPPVWVACLGLISVISFVAWASNLRRNRAIADTPTSRVASAAQGYVELYGPAVRGAEFLARSRLSGMPCVWYRHVTYQKNSDGEWAEIARGTSDTLFALEDGSGRCLIDPDHAEVITTHSRTWIEGDYKHIEEQLFASDNIYALGEFTTVGGANAHLDLKQDVVAMLAEWKKDQLSLLKRFDLNRDGQIDLQEWELARRAAIREVEKQHRDLRMQPGVHVMRAPSGGQMYLLSNLSPQQLKNRYVRWGWIHLLTFFAAAAGTASIGLGAALW